MHKSHHVEATASSMDDDGEGGRDDHLLTVRDGYDDVADAYAEHRSQEGAGTDLVRSFAGDLPDGARVLDAGCGGGLPATDLLSERHDVVGLDVSRTQVTRLRANVPDAVPVEGELSRLPFTDASFDALASLFAVIHVPRERHAAVFAEFHRVICPGGAGLLVVGHEAWEGHNPDWLDTGTEMRWSYHGLDTTRRLLREAGFDVSVVPRATADIGDGFRYVRVTA